MLDNVSAPPLRADLILRGGHVIDPVHGLDGIADIAVQAGRIVAVGADAMVLQARREIDARGLTVCPGFIDLHVHCFEWLTNFGVPPDAVGINSGATTVVDQGSTGAWTVRGFKAFIADPAKTDVRAFVSVNLAGALQGGMEGTTLHNPDMARTEALLDVAAEHPRLVRGIKCHAESGSMSHWDIAVLAKAAEAGRAAGLPLYVHTGELFPVNAATRPAPDTVLPRALPLFKPGDVIAHVYSCMPDGVMGPGDAVPGWIAEAKAAGILFDLGHGVNLSFRIARKMLERGILPDTLGSDVHADFNSFHDFSSLDYSLLGGLNKLHALGIPLVELVRALTATPARVLLDSTIGHLGVGARANITVLRSVEGAWTYRDALGEALTVERRLLPELVVLDGDVLVPDCALLSDVIAPASRPRGVTPRLENAHV
jgi:dihydroorotase